MSRARDTANQINRVNSSAADATALTVDSSENIGVGLSTNIASKLHVNSELSLGQDNNNRMIVGSTSGGVGSIGTIEGGTASFSSMTFKGGNVGIGTSNPTAKFSVTGSTSGDYLAKIESTNQFGLKIKTTSTSNSHEQFAIHDGNNNVQFKVMGGGNVHATGIYLGGTGAVNKLDDYETGTWTPDISWTGVNSETYSRQVGSYIKIGQFVYCSIALIFDKNTSTGNFGMGGFPFTNNASSSNDRGVGSFGYYAGMTDGSIAPMFLMEHNQTFGYFRLSGGGQGSGNGNNVMNNGSIGSTVNFHMDVTYRTTQ